ncbi:hypothetical protein BD414DRAFT_509616 [Trametes punicea]|nr:hypothetical protein BD414DRAFT_509616 [Trametes punicea]
MSLRRAAVGHQNNACEEQRPRGLPSCTLHRGSGMGGHVLRWQEKEYVNLPSMSGLDKNSGKSLEVADFLAAFANRRSSSIDAFRERGWHSDQIVSAIECFLALDTVDARQIFGNRSGQPVVRLLRAQGVIGGPSTFGRPGTVIGCGTTCWQCSTSASRCTVTAARLLPELYAKAGTEIDPLQHHARGARTSTDDLFPGLRRYRAEHTASEVGPIGCCVSMRVLFDLRAQRTRLAGGPSALYVRTRAATQCTESTALVKRRKNADTAREGVDGRQGTRRRVGARKAAAGELGLAFDGRHVAKRLPRQLDSPTSVSS